MASEMKPCPFCGSNQLSFRSTPDMDTDGKFHRISCNECGASSRATFAMDACPLFYEELRNVWNTRPAPAATDTGLETVGFVANGYFSQPRSERDWDEIFQSVRTPENFTAVVTRSQAEELLAAERAENNRLREINKAHCETVNTLTISGARLDDTIRKLKADAENFADEIKEAAYEAWPEANDVGSDAPDIIRQLGRERAEFLAEVEDLKDKLYRAEADNAAQAARIKELEAVYERLGQQALKDRNLRNEAQSDADLWRFSVDMGDHPSLLVKVWKQRKALEAKLAAAEKVREAAIELDEAISDDFNIFGAQQKLRAVLGRKPS